MFRFGGLMASCGLVVGLAVACGAEADSDEAVAVCDAVAEVDDATVRAIARGSSRGDDIAEVTASVAALEATSEAAGETAIARAGERYASLLRAQLTGERSAGLEEQRALVEAQCAELGIALTLAFFLPDPTPEPAPTPTPAPTSTPEPTATPRPTATPKPTPTPTPPPVEGDPCTELGPAETDELANLLGGFHCIEGRESTVWFRASYATATDGVGIMYEWDGGAASMDGLKGANAGLFVTRARGPAALADSFGNTLWCFGYGVINTSTGPLGYGIFDFGLLTPSGTVLTPSLPFGFDPLPGSGTLQSLGSAGDYVCFDQQAEPGRYALVYEPFIIGSQARTLNYFDW